MADEARSGGEQGGQLAQAPDARHARRPVDVRLRGCLVAIAAAVEPDAEHPGLVRPDRIGAHSIAQVGARRGRCVEGGGRGREDGRVGLGDAEGSAGGWWGSVLPGVWSFQLAARARGLGSTWTTFHLAHESKISELLGIPSTVSQCALLPVAYYTGETFHPAPRRSVDEVTYLNGWKQPVR